jgi:hypothetical protein
MKFMEIERNFLGLKTGSSRVLRGTKCPRRSPDVCHKTQKSMETLLNVPYSNAVRIRDGAPKFVRAPKISPVSVL